MQESRPSRVMQKHVSAVSKEHSYDGLSLDDKHALPTVWEFITSSLLLPLRLFFTEPIVTLASIMAATVYGIMYLFSESFGMVYGDSFGFTPEQSALVILAIAVGIVPTTLPMLYDVRVAGRRQREGRDLQPEDKLFGFYLAAPSLAISLWWFALTVPPLATGISPWVSIVALTPIGFSTSEFGKLLNGFNRAAQLMERYRYCTLRVPHRFLRLVRRIRQCSYVVSARNDLRPSTTGRQIYVH